MNLFRLPGWETRLANYMTLAARKKFDRSSFDCVRFTADALYEIIGMDMADEFRHKYKTDEEARNLIQSLGDDGFHRVLSEIAAKWGFPIIDWKQARRGDPVFLVSIRDDPWSGGLGICMGSVAYAPSKSGGLQQIPMRACRTVWSIPYA